MVRRRGEWERRRRGGGQDRHPKKGHRAQHVRPRRSSRMVDALASSAARSSSISSLAPLRVVSLIRPSSLAHSHIFLPTCANSPYPSPPPTLPKPPKKPNQEATLTYLTLPRQVVRVDAAAVEGDEQVGAAVTVRNGQFGGGHFLAGRACCRRACQRCPLALSWEPVGGLMVRVCGVVGYEMEAWAVCEFQLLLSLGRGRAVVYVFVCLCFYSHAALLAAYMSREMGWGGRAKQRRWCRSHSRSPPIPHLLARPLCSQMYPKP